MSAEFEVIERFFKSRAAAGDNLLLGIGDDAAITRMPPDCDLVTATDALVEGTHFLPQAPARSVGHRCLAVNLSDLAAMGAEPLWASLALCLPRVEEEWIQGFSDGFFELAEESGVLLIGGDTVYGQRAATVTLQGSVPKGCAVRRVGAQAGDLIYVTGSPGDAAAGRMLASGDLPSFDKTNVYRDILINSFYYPQPRMLAGQQLRGLASAMIDISDGLAVDLARLLIASGVGAGLDVGQLPLSSALQAAVASERAIELALCGGEDYELCFTVAAERSDELAAAAVNWGCSITCIGSVLAEQQITWSHAGAPYTVPAANFEHFN